MLYSGYLHDMQCMDKTSLFTLSFATIQSHIGQKVLHQHSFIFGHMAMKHPVCSYQAALR